MILNLTVIKYFTVFYDPFFCMTLLIILSSFNLSMRMLINILLPLPLLFLLLLLLLFLLLLLSRCYLRSYLVKNTAGAHKEPSKKYKNNLQTLKARATSNAELNTSIVIIKHLIFISWTTDLPDLIKF